MDGEKIYPASPYKIKKKREEGQVPKSTELIALGVLLTSFSYLYVTRNNLINLMNKMLTMLNADINKPFNTDMFGEYIKVILLAVTPLFACIVIGAILINYVQVGFMLSPKALKPNLKKINPISGFKRIFSKDTFVDLIKSIVKIIGVIYIAYNELEVLVFQVTKTYTENMQLSWDMLFVNLFKISLKIYVLLLFLSILDYAYKRFKFYNDMKMTRQEMIEENKHLEGNPLIKQKQKEFGRMLTKRQIQKVKEATVVITNPTHYAVALKFDPVTHPIPVVIFKGVDEVAQKAKEIARENKIPIVENVPLARALYAKVDEDSIISKEFYESVSLVISNIMKMDKKLQKRFSKNYK